MDKLYYVIKTLSRTKRKDWENYVLNAVWNRLRNWDLKPVSQQYIRIPGNRGVADKAYLIDLYFPQLNIGIECDEQYHLRSEDQQKDDFQREIEITDFLNQVTQEKINTYKPIHIKNYLGANGERILDPVDFEKQIDDCVSSIKEAFKEEKKKPSFMVWKDSISAEDYYKDRDTVRVSDEVGFSSIISVCNTLFGTNYRGMRKSYFIPKTLREKYGEEYILWFPKLAISEKAVTDGWNNQLTEDGKKIIQFNEHRQVKGLKNPKKRITFAQTKDPITGKREYRFFGVFRYEDLINKKELYSLCENSFPIIKQ